MSKKRERTRSHLQVYATQSVRCAVCYWRKGRPGRAIELHHIVGRRGLDHHHHRNLLCVCDQCHYGYHSGGSKSLDLGHILQAKLEEDGEVDLEFLARLMGRKGLREDPKPLPEWVKKERDANSKK